MKYVKRFLVKGKQQQEKMRERWQQQQRELNQFKEALNKEKWNRRTK